MRTGRKPRRNWRREKSRGQVRERGSLLLYLCQRLGEDGCRCPVLDRLGREMAAERARARYAMEKPEHVPGDGIEAHALDELALDVGNEREQGVLARVERRQHAEEFGIDLQKLPLLLISRTPHHHAVQALGLHARLLDASEAAVEHDRQIGVRGFQPAH